MTIALLSVLAAVSAGAAQTPRPDQSSTRSDSPEPATLVRLLSVRRIYVDRFGGGDTAQQLRDMIISSLQATKLFVITENESRADAILRGSAEDLVFTDTFSSSESLNARASLSTGTDPDKTASDRRSRYGGVTVGQNESTRTAERKHEAVASVRLVDRDGDVLWSTTQESRGGKFRGASADVADRIAKQLARDHERARRPRGASEK